MLQNDYCRIFFYDHRAGYQESGMVGNLYFTSLVKELSLKLVEDPREATHAIVHLDPLERAKRGEWPDQATTDQIILCLTSAGSYPSETYPNRVSTIKGYTRVTFFGRSTVPLEDKETLEEFCQLKIEDAKRIVSGDTSSLSFKLRKVLTDESLDYLPALAVLCQGYLWVYSLDNKEEFKTSTSETISTPDWWLDPFDCSANPTSLLNHAEEEWKKMCLGEHQSWEKIKSLLDSFSHKDSSISVHLVRDAYEALKLIYL